MQRNKYLDDLGIPIKEYGCNEFVDDPRSEIWAKQREEYGFDSRECWNLQWTFFEWLYSHLTMYKEEACVDLSFHKFTFENKQYTQAEAIDYILERLKDALVNKDYNYNTVRDAFRMWAEIYAACWW